MRQSEKTVKNENSMALRVHTQIVIQSNFQIIIIELSDE